MKITKARVASVVILLLIVSLSGFVISSFQNNDTPNITGTDEDNGSDTDPSSNDTNVNSVEVDGISVAEDGVVNVSVKEVVRNHRESLLSSSVSMSYSTPTETYAIRKFGNTIYKTIEAGFSSREEYSNGVLTYQISSFGEETEYSVRSEPISDTQYHRDSVISAILSDLSVSNIEELDNGYRMELSGNSDFGTLSTVLSEADEINSADATIEMTDDGTIRFFELSTSGNGPFGIPQTGTYEYLVTEVGNVQVTEPTWVLEAKESRSIINATIDTGNNWIVLEHTGLADIPSGSVINIVTSTGDTQNVTVPQEFTVDDVAYLRPQSLGNWEISINETPSSDGQIALSENTEILIEIAEGTESNSTVFFREIISSQ